VVSSASLLTAHCISYPATENLFRLFWQNIARGRMHPLRLFSSTPMCDVHPAFLCLLKTVFPWHFVVVFEIT
jgi:hypothetical protein